jgi:hypothetical protein
MATAYVRRIQGAVTGVEDKLERGVEDVGMA